MFIMIFLSSILKQRSRKSFCSFLSLHSQCHFLSLHAQRDSFISFMGKKELLPHQVLFERQTLTKNQKFIFPMFVFIVFLIYNFFILMVIQLFPPSSVRHIPLLPTVEQYTSHFPASRSFLFDNLKYFEVSIVDYLWITLLRRRLGRDIGAIIFVHFPRKSMEAYHSGKIISVIPASSDGCRVQCWSLHATDIQQILLDNFRNGPPPSSNFYKIRVIFIWHLPLNENISQMNYLPFTPI